LVRQVVLNTGPPEADAKDAPVTAQTALISIVDDGDSMRSSLVALISSLGHETCAFGSAEEFLEAGTARRASCIISDIQMPGMSGLDLQRRLAEQDVLTPMIMMTAREEADLKEWALAGGAFCFLKKPFDADILVECVERALKLSS
jgi:FixJ family two-component response regulator